MTEALGGEMRRVAGGLLLVCAAALLVACARAPIAPRAEPSPVATPTVQPLVLQESSYRWIPPKTRYPFNAAVDFALVVRNPNTSVGATSAIVHVEMLDAAGRPFFDGDDLDIGPIRPGETVTFCMQEFPDHEPAAVRFTVAAPAGACVSANRWLPVGFQSLAVKGLALGQTTGKPDPDLVGFASDHSYLTGEVVNSNPVAFQTVSVDVLGRDGDGRIAVHYGDFVEDVPASGRRHFRIEIPDRLAPSLRFEARVRPSFSRDDALPISASGGQR